MNSFISNSKSEGRVLLAVVALAALCEVSLRFGSDRLSADLAHIRTIPAVAATMAKAQGVRILFLGNSLTREGIDLDSVRAGLECRGSTSVVCERVYPDDTTVLDWYYLFRHYFPGRSAPDCLVLGYVKQQLTDGTSIHPDRIAAYFGGWSNAREVLRADLDTLNGRMDYMLSSTFRLFAERERVRDRVLSVAAPDYRATATRLNEAERVRAAGDGKSKPESYTRLERLLSLCDQRGVRAVVVAIPQPEPYYVDPGLLTLLARHRAAFLDMRRAQGLTGHDYTDGYHLSRHGAQLYSEALGRRLREGIVNCRPPSAPTATSIARDGSPGPLKTLEVRAGRPGEGLRLEVAAAPTPTSP